MKKWYKSKTLWFNIIVAGLIALEASFPMLQSFFSVNVYAVLATALAVGNAMLRVVTLQGIFKIGE